MPASVAELKARTENARRLMKAQGIDCLIVTDPLNVQLTGLPKNVASLGATWSPVKRFSTYGELRYTGRMFIDTTSVRDTFYEQGGSTVFNASARYAYDKSTDLTASVINLFNKEYSENAYSFNQVYNRNLSMPRTINLALKTRF